MERFFIAQIGRTVGLRGDLKLHLHTDFPEQFKAGQTYHSDRGELTVSAIDLQKSIVRFVGYEGMDSAKKLTNAKLYATLEETKANCDLAQGQHFWFEIIGCEAIENGLKLGVVIEIQRILDIDYLEIKTDMGLVEQGMAKNFLIPYIPRYIVQTDIQNKTILTQDAKDILEAS